MKIEIKSFSSHKTSKIISLMFAVLTLPFALMGFLGFFFAPELKTSDGETMPNFPFLFFTFAPIFYGLMFYIMNRTILFIYNQLAKRIGGIEFETSQSDNKP
ncbi:hypothetical protein [Pseudoalteromonas sp. H105]|uniref:hypothetical protein n=1 Tax=Pseudoalteromonas sp. H105 TaxID=1348393 RepID=UPI000731FF98|nr:hypothetical protein [Pseudoalteromonas sp. H105]KTF16110.1 hypothetical protein ATS75_06835 [Pseudoalteromonas sp. H105]